jgi:predicted nuclease of predicted toxin-antitoxin system
VKILFDQNVPRPLALFLSAHEVRRAAELGWQKLSNGDLIASAEANGFEVIITADKNLRYQQNLKNRKLAIVVLPWGRWPKIRPLVVKIAKAVDEASAGSFAEIDPGTGI